MTDDLIRSLGYLTLGSRLKRLGEQLQGDVARLSQDLGLPVQAGHYLILAALDQSGPLTIGRLAQTIGVSQPAVTRSVAGLLEQCLVEPIANPGDLRQRTIALTASGAVFVSHVKHVVWPAIEAAVRLLCQDLSGSLLDQITGMETALATEPLDRRARTLLSAKEEQPDAPA